MPAPHDSHNPIDLLEQAVIAANLQRPTLPDEYHYASLPLCVVDAIFSIGVRYSTTAATVERFCKFAGWQKCNYARLPDEGGEFSIAEFLDLISAMPDDQAAKQIYGNRQRTSSRNGILKAQAVRLFADALLSAGVNDYGDITPERITATEAMILGTPGQSSGISFDYFQMLAGNHNLIKPDRMIQRFIAKALEISTLPSPRQCTAFLHALCTRLHERGENWTPLHLDHAIWARESKLAETNRTTD